MIDHPVWLDPRLIELEQLHDELELATAMGKVQLEVLLGENGIEDGTPMPVYDLEHLVCGKSYRDYNVETYSLALVMIRKRWWGRRIELAMSLGDDQDELRELERLRNDAVSQPGDYDLRGEPNFVTGFEADWPADEQYAKLFLSKSRRRNE